MARNKKRLRRRSDAVTQGPKIKAHGTTDADHNSRCPDFCFHYTSTSGYSVEDCDAQAKIALIDALWKDSNGQEAVICPFDRDKLPDKDVLSLLDKNGVKTKLTSFSSSKSQPRLMARLSKVGAKRNENLASGSGSACRFRVNLKNNRKAFTRV